MDGYGSDRPRTGIELMIREQNEAHARWIKNEIDEQNPQKITLNEFLNNIEPNGIEPICIGTDVKRKIAKRCRSPFGGPYIGDPLIYINGVMVGVASDLPNNVAVKVSRSNRRSYVKVYKIID